MVVVVVVVFCRHEEVHLRHLVLRMQVHHAFTSCIGF